MPQAKWNGVVIADAAAGDVVQLEGNTYFPAGSIKNEYVKETKENYTCPWKGTCNYYDIVVDGKTNPGAAWVYRTPKDAAKQIAGFYAFWKGVQIG